MTGRPSKRTKIVATIGPASSEPAILGDLIRGGLDVARINFSHGTHASHAAAIAAIRSVAAELQTPVGILQDLPGPKVRTGPLEADQESVHLTAGQRFTLTTRPVAGSVATVSVNYAGLPNDVAVGKRLYLSDGAIALRIERIVGERIETRVEVGGDLRAAQGINYPEGSLGLEAVTERDFEHLAFGLDAGVDWVAVSFVKSADDIIRVKRFIGGRGRSVGVIAKIEKHEALVAIDEIIAASDGIMVARGDLGIEIPLEAVPLAQKDFIARANRASKPVITATQMLESMISSPRPTRAESADVANAILDGTDALMLSGETARGKYPVEALRTMATIATQIETQYPHDVLRYRRMAHVEPLDRDDDRRRRGTDGRSPGSRVYRDRHVDRQHGAVDFILSAARTHRSHDALARSGAAHDAGLGRRNADRRAVPLFRNADRNRRRAHVT